MNEKKQIRVLIVEPNKKAKLAYIDDTLEVMQTIVGGHMEAIMPFDDDVALVCNESGIRLRLDPNRVLRSEDGTKIDILVGTFFICSAPYDSDRFESLSESQSKKYEKLYCYPERFLNTKNDFQVVEISPIPKPFER